MRNQKFAICVLILYNLSSSSSIFSMLSTQVHVKTTEKIVVKDTTRIVDFLNVAYEKLSKGTITVQDPGGIQFVLSKIVTFCAGKCEYLEIVTDRFFLDDKVVTPIFNKILSSEAKNFKNLTILYSMDRYKESADKIIAHRVNVHRGRGRKVIIVSRDNFDKMGNRDYEPLCFNMHTTKGILISTCHFVESSDVNLENMHTKADNPSDPLTFDIIKFSCKCVYTVFPPSKPKDIIKQLTVIRKSPETPKPELATVPKIESKSKKKKIVVIKSKPEPVMQFSQAKIIMPRIPKILFVVNKETKTIDPQNKIL